MAIGATCACAVAAAQALPGGATYLEGGIVTWPWVWQDPQNSGEYAVWTVEDGSRMRFARFTVGSYYPSTPWVWVSPTQPQDVILRHVSVADDGLDGIAVGDEATWLWAIDSVSGGTNGAGGVWRPAHLTLPSGFPSDTRLWHVFQNTTAPEEAWVAGENGLLAWTPDGVDHFIDLFACNFVTPAGAPFSLPIGDLTGVAFTSDMSAGAAVGDLLTTMDSDQPPPGLYVQGGIYYTTNGQDWHQSTLYFREPNGNLVAAPNEVRFWKVAFVPNSMTGFAVGGSESETGYLMTTFDGGATWEEEHHECRDIGAQWCGPLTATCTTPSALCESLPSNLPKGRGKTLSQYGVSTFADESALSVGYGGQILRRDPFVSGTRKWIDVTDRCGFSTQPLWGVHNSPDGKLSILTGAPGQIRASIDSGGTWKNLGTEGGWRSHAIEVVATGGASNGEVIWTCGQASRISVSVDRGAHFTTQRAETVGNRKLQTLLAIAMRDDGDGVLDNDLGVAVGKVWNSGNQPAWTILYTSSGGEVNSSTCGWSESTMVSPVGVVPSDLLTVVYAGDLQSGAPSFWCAGYGNTVLRSSDAGVTWTLNGPCSPSTPGGCTPQVGDITDWLAVSFASVDEGWLSGFDHNANAPVVFRTTDAGGTANATWSPVLPALAEPLVDLHSRGGATFGVTASGGLYRWNSSTLVFDAMPAGTSPVPTLSDVEVTLDTSGGVHVYVAGDKGVLHRFNGATSAWSQLRPESNFTAAGLAFVSAELGYELFDQDADPADGGSARVITRIE